MVSASTIALRLLFKRLSSSSALLRSVISMFDPLNFTTLPSLSTIGSQIVITILSVLSGRRRRNSKL
ncbi:hypothetical protein MBAV_004338 [Candidatus Magnetobacterium bavaricum]|uniref:Uncharacterized protein n=1 Tax=Candidatus Magnetobacterium bavaricum TaxID=29290 RepID=A0A0F3GRZ1_9BACT|nr:hypothetical protein MBAV_004338 [Candidatus Magnetobacterium bavaricum]